jgi:superkiller protein 3
MAALSQRDGIQTLQVLHAPDSVIERLLAEHKFEQAETILVHELSTSPRDGKLLIMLSQLYFDEHRYGEASSTLTSADQVMGPTTDGEVLAGLIEVVRGNLPAAEQRYLKALSLDPKNAPAHYYLGRALYARQSLREAITQFKAAITLDPSIIRAYDGLGMAYQALGAREDATHWFQQGIEEEQRFPERQSEWLPLDFATFLLPYGASDQVNQLLELALARNSMNAEVHYQFGAYYYRRAQYDEAIKALQRAFQIDPRNARAHYLCGRSYHALHQEDQAREEFAKFHELSERASTP